VTREFLNQQCDPWICFSCETKS